MQEVAACLLGPYLAHIVAKVYKDDTLSNSSPRKNVNRIEVKLQCRMCCQFTLKTFGLQVNYWFIFFLCSILTPNPALMRAVLSLEYHYIAWLPVCQCHSPKRQRKPHLQHTETSFAYKPVIPTWKYKTLPENSLSLNTLHGKHAKIIDTGLERKKEKEKNPLLSKPLFSGPGWCKQEGITLPLKAVNCMDTIGKSSIKLHVLNTEARQLLYILYIA